MTKHEEYFYRTLYAIILVSPNGGQRWNVFNDEDKARADADELIGNISDANDTGYKVYISYLDYCPKKGRLVSSDIITDESELLYEC